LRGMSAFNQRMSQRASERARLPERVIARVLRKIRRLERRTRSSTRRYLQPAGRFRDPRIRAFLIDLAELIRSIIPRRVTTLLNLNDAERYQEIKRDRYKYIYCEEEISPNSRVSHLDALQCKMTMSPQLSSQPRVIVARRPLSRVSFRPSLMRDVIRVSARFRCRGERRKKRPGRPTGCQSSRRDDGTLRYANAKREQKGKKRDAALLSAHLASPPRRRCTPRRIRIFRQFYCHAAYARARARQ